jgi:hypothetical protein
MEIRNSDTADSTADTEVGIGLSILRTMDIGPGGGQWVHPLAAVASPSGHPMGVEVAGACRSTVVKADRRLLE